MECLRYHEPILLNSVFCSEAEIATASLSEVVHDRQLVVAVNGDNNKLKQCSQPRADCVKLTVINVETNDDVELIECCLETGKHSSVSFKFSRLTDQPTDVAASLVSCLLKAAMLHSHFSSFLS